MIVLNSKTNKDLFQLVMCFFVHSDINFIISQRNEYKTDVCNQIKLCFELNNSVVEKPTICMTMKVETNSVGSSIEVYTYQIDLLKSLVDIIETVIKIIISRIDLLEINHNELNNDWKILLSKVGR